MPQWHREIAYDAIAEQLFNSLKHERLLLETTAHGREASADTGFLQFDKSYPRSSAIRIRLLASLVEHAIGN